MLRIIPVGMHWLPEVPPSSDLCAHASVRVELGGVVLLDSGAETFAVSTAAVHLLRTLGDEHTAERPLVDHLLPHCGHFMHYDDTTGELRNMGCAAGMNWWVHHDGQTVMLDLRDVAPVRVSRGDWAQAVADFADAVDGFYAAAAPKEPLDEYESQWYHALRGEWRRRRARIGRALAS